MTWYILDDRGESVQTDDVLAVSQMMQDTQRRVVGHTELADDLLVSTVFFPIDYGNNGEVLLWETMIFGGPHNDYQERYTSRAAAEEGHKRAVELAKKGATS